MKSPEITRRSTLESRVSAASIKSTTLRRIYINTPGLITESFKLNKVETSKYTLLSFIPKNIYKQFQGLANFYFLAIVILQAFPQFAQVSIVVVAAPIVVILLATAVKVSKL